MKVLVAVSSPGPAESLVLLVAQLRARGIETELINVSNDSGGTLQQKDLYQGSRGILRNSGVDFTEADAFGALPDYFNVPIDFAGSIIDTLQPDKIVVGTYRDLTKDRVTLEDAMIVSAQKHGVPVFQFVDMWDNWFQKNSLVIAPDFFLVQDAITEKLIRKRGGGKGKCIIVGSPSLENFARMKTGRKHLKKEEFCLQDKRVIAYFGQCFPVQNELSLPWSLDALSGGDVLLFSKHPRDTRDYVRPYRGDQRLKELSVPSDDILELADVCLTHTSTMSLKAALLKIKTINIIPEGECTELLNECGGYPLSLMGGSSLVQTGEALRDALSRHFSCTPEFERFRQTMITGHGVATMCNAVTAFY